MVCQPSLSTNGEVCEASLEDTKARIENLLASISGRWGSKPNHYERPKGLNFDDVCKALRGAHYDLVSSLWHMENSGGEVDIITSTRNNFSFYDCSKESPGKRRNCTYNQVEKMAQAWRVKMLDQYLYENLQERGNFDDATTSWIAAPYGFSPQSGVLSAGRFDRKMRLFRSAGTEHLLNRGWRGQLVIPKIA